MEAVLAHTTLQHTEDPTTMRERERARERERESHVRVAAGDEVSSYPVPHLTC